MISVVVPALDEERDIAGCLAAVAAQDVDEELEVILVDGCSADRTVEVALAAGTPPPVVVTNPRRRTSTSLNAGLAVARGDVVVRVDARSRIEPHYVRTCAEVLAERPDVGVVGGAQLAAARSDRAVDAGIARALRNRWATGLSRYRRATRSGPSDTVWMGAFRTDELRALGGWSDEVALNEDYELNERYRRAGMVVWFDARLRSAYLPRATLADLGRQHFRFGRVKGTWWARGTRPSPRQVVLLAAPVAVAGGLAAVARSQGVVGAGALAVAGLAALDTAGTRDPAPPAARAVAAAGTGVIAATWWAGVAVGVVGELAGVEHRDG